MSFHMEGGKGPSVRRGLKRIDPIGVDLVSAEVCIFVIQETGFFKGSYGMWPHGRF